MKDKQAYEKRELIMECPGLYYRGCSFIIYSINAYIKSLLNAKSQRDRHVRFLLFYLFVFIALVKLLV